MTRDSFLIFLGLVVIVSPFAGLPLLWLSWGLPVVGFLIIVTALLIRHEHGASTNVEEDV